jgi:hypothetical protein
VEPSEPVQASIGITIPLTLSYGKCHKQNLLKFNNEHREERMLYGSARTMGN